MGSPDNTLMQRSGHHHLPPPLPSSVAGSFHSLSNTLSCRRRSLNFVHKFFMDKERMATFSHRSRCCVWIPWITACGSACSSCSHLYSHCPHLQTRRHITMLTNHRSPTGIRVLQLSFPGFSFITVPTPICKAWSTRKSVCISMA